MAIGYITFNVHTADDALPVGDAHIVVNDQNGTVLVDTVSDMNGNTGTFPIMCPPRDLSLDSEYDGVPYTRCDVHVRHNGFQPINYHDVSIFDGETSILPIDFHPGLDDEEIYIPPTALEIADVQRQVGSNVQLLRDVFIPEYITVHLGIPTNTSARNVKVKFSDYVKNVVSSEIYPTWPDASLLANIHAITTFALNRVYTEWYPSRGFGFDITNSTAYDQFFVEGRNIFENISRMVDEVFNIYVRRFGFRNPFFTQFCSGTTVTCPGMSQWGTVELANGGFTPIQILRHYYPRDVELAESNDIMPITASYPGYALRLGSVGTNVQRMQNFLNRIRQNFPLIPLISNPNGVFDSDTETAVRTFQRSFNLAVDGIIGKATWNKITFIYVGVLRLAELDSEGERITIGQTPPTSVLRLNSRGGDVLELQFILNVISQYYHSVPPVIQDSVFGKGTQNAVIEFQKTFGLTPDGIVGPRTWDMLYMVYMGIEENVKVPEQEVPVVHAPPFPGTLIREGSIGPDVRLMQNYLNAIRIVYPSIPQLVSDGVFGPRTKDAVIAFQREFLLVPDGIIGPITWDEIVRQFLLVTGRV